jgi:23S rRNA (cytidine1920-2'-O)/16S rRNA (cytidine1409-2'-O)-methyltransferase
MTDPSCPFVSRGGLKLAAALDAFHIDPRDFTCADLGCNVGGFTDCLLQRGAAHVYAVDTGYGMLAWKLRQDPRLTVLERTNALHFNPADVVAPGAENPGGFTGCDLVVIDLAWTRQQHAVPAALRWLRRPGPALTPADTSALPAPARPGRIITLIKPHYEADRPMLTHGRRGVLSEDEAAQVLTRVLEGMPALGVRVLGHIPSPIRGGAGKGRTGNVEFLALLEQA